MNWEYSLFLLVYNCGSEKGQSAKGEYSKDNVIKWFNKKIKKSFPSFSIAWYGIVVFE